LVNLDEDATGGDGDLRGAAKALADELHISHTLASILVRRGITTREQAHIFFRPTMDDLHDPYLMDGMKLAVERIIGAVQSGEQITVYGDYDVDGTNGTALLYAFLQSLGAKVRFYIPERLKEGYGVSNAGIERAHEAGTRLLVTVDCGITAHPQVEYARTLGMEVIICDHHEPGERAPSAYAVLDPLKPACQYPFKYLSGCGVAFKLVQALFTHEYVQTRLGGESLEALASYLDFVALATTADIVPLTGENRTLVKLGLELINTRPRPGIRALIESSGLTLGKINSGNIVFVIAPRINAVGRLGDARRAVELLTCPSPDEAAVLARVFEEENRSRRKLDEDTFAEAQELAE
jgi:single-stranded-DNA-specific exonuclease